MMKKVFLIFIILFLYNQNAFSRAIISGISNNEINIDTNFNGTKILLFGAKGDAGNIVIAVRGPKKNFIVTKKEKLLGVWYNGKRIKFSDSFSYYSLFSTFINNQTTNNLLSQLELGANNLKFATEDENNNEFKIQLINKLEKDELFSIGANKIDFLDETLFKVMLNFPKNISRGIYTVEIYLINEDSLISFQSIPIYVNQVGLSAQISDYAHQQSLLYGLIAVFVALIIGWLTNYLFVRFVGK
ncbi:MAG TPA: TIGR02186 family protein [Rickettsiales bacterium]|nr:TIGR02186 family protein [Rickettsiales bacterium]